MVDRNGTQVTVESPTGARYTRNTSYLTPIITEGQRFNENCEPIVPDLQDVHDEFNA